MATSVVVPTLGIGKLANALGDDNRCPKVAEVIPKCHDSAWVAATSGRAAAIVHAVGWSSEVAYIPAGVLPTAANHLRHGVAMNGQWKRGDGKTAPKAEVPHFPKIHKVLPTFDPDNAVVVTLPASDLHNLVSALNSDSDRIGFIFSRDGLTGECAGNVGVIGEHGIGVIVPVPFGRQLSDYTAIRDAYVADAEKWRP